MYGEVNTTCCSHCEQDQLKIIQNAKSFGFKKLVVNQKLLLSLHMVFTGSCITLKH